MLDSDRDKRSRKTIFNRNNSTTTREPVKELQTQNIRISLLETQLKAKEGELERVKLQLSDEKEKRRRGELERTELVRHVQLKDKELEEMQLQLKRVLK